MCYNVNSGFFRVACRMSSLSMKSHTTTGSKLPTYETYDDPMDCDPPLEEYDEDDDEDEDEDEDDGMFRIKWIRRSKKSLEYFRRGCEEELGEYAKLSPYDATYPPPGLGGGFPVQPLVITETNRPMLINLSHLALASYNKDSHASFEFVAIVKCTHWFDFRMNAFAPDPPPLRPTRYYITFQAKEKAHPLITIFRAKVIVDAVDKEKPPVVEECFPK